jgi:hypothetical protein
MNLESMSTPELYALYRNAQMILFARLWWILPIFFAVCITGLYLFWDINEGGFFSSFLHEITGKLSRKKGEKRR